MRFLFIFIAVLLFADTSLAAPTPGVITFNAYTSTNATTGAYTTFIASTIAPFSAFFLCDTSGKFIKLATGAAGSEVDLTGAPVSGCIEVHTDKLIPAGTRISFRALDANATTGGLMMSLSR